MYSDLKVTSVNYSILCCIYYRRKVKSRCTNARCVENKRVDYSCVMLAGIERGRKELSYVTPSRIEHYLMWSAVAYLPEQVISLLWLSVHELANVRIWADFNTQSSERKRYAEGIRTRSAINIHVLIVVELCHIDILENGMKQMLILAANAYPKTKDTMQKYAAYISSLRHTYAMLVMFW